MKTPNYYIGKFLGIKAKDICADYDLSYNLGSAVCYLLRAGKKEENPKEQDIRKAIDHLNFELEKIELEKTK
jgi:outer membrane lipoprotein-sorting protein